MTTSRHPALLASLFLGLAACAAPAVEDAQHSARSSVSSPTQPRTSAAGKASKANGAAAASDDDDSVAAVGGPAGAATIWHPRPGTSWQWQLSGNIDVSVDASVYDVDLFTTSQATIDDLHAKGRKVVCYFSAGSHEPNRPDSAEFPAAAIGSVMDGWPDERWLDVRDPTVKAIMKRRLDIAAEKKCDAVEPDNVDGYSNESGFSLTEGDQLTFNRFLATEAHAPTRHLAIALKNDVEQIGALVSSFDFALNEECMQNDECETLEPFIQAGKAVFHVEYGDAALASTVCPDANAKNFDTLIKNVDLDAQRVACR